MKQKQPTGYPSIDKPWLKYYDEQAWVLQLPQQSLYEHIYSRNKDNMSSNALMYFGKRITYKEMFHEIDIVASAFASIGVKEGEIVSFLMPTIPETIYALYAVNKIGAIANMLDLSTNDAFIHDRIKTTKSKCLLVLDALKERILSLCDDLAIEKVISISPTNSLPIIDYLSKLKQKKDRSITSISVAVEWKKFIKLGTQKNSIRPIPYKKARPALIVYTGGTTGVPKGAVLSNDGINATIMQLKETGIKSKPGDRYLDIMPPFIAYGVVCGIHNPLSERQEIVIIPKLDPIKFPRYIVKYKPNHIIGVPALFESMLISPDLKKKKLSFLQNIICGGDKLSMSSEKKINAFLSEHQSMAQIAQGFGMTEVGTSVTFTVSHHAELRENHIGIPLVLTNIKIVVPGTDKELKYNEKGEICIATPSVMLGYYDNDMETQNVLKKHADGVMWIHSKDIGYMDTDGELYFLDRIKRMIVRHDGHNVWPGAIEQIISTHYAVEACTVIGIKNKDNTNGATVAAVIVLKNEYIEQKIKVLKEIDLMCRERLPGRDIAQVYKTIECIPKTPLGKTDYRALEEWAAQN